MINVLNWNKKKTNKNNVMYVDAAKFIAMIAVMIQHTSSKYINNNFKHVHFFATTLFILCSGIVIYISLNKKENKISYITKKLIGLLETYVISSFLCFIIWNRGFDIVQYFKGLLHFNVQGPYYYMLVYFELLSISPFLYKLINKFKDKYAKITIFIAVFIISIALNRYKLFDVKLGGAIFLEERIY